MIAIQATSRRSCRRQRGTAMVEFCIGAPILLLLMCGTAELGQMLTQASELADAARNAARYVSSNALLGSTGVINLNGQLIRTAQNMAVYGNAFGFGRPLVPNLARGNVTIVAENTTDISVAINYPYESLFGGFLPLFFRPGGIFTARIMTAYASMRAL